MVLYVEVVCTHTYDVSLDFFEPNKSSFLDNFVVPYLFANTRSLFPMEQEVIDTLFILICLDGIPFSYTLHLFWVYHVG